MMPVQARNYHENPFIVIWEVTRACALKCLHCRAEAQYHPHPDQLSLEEGKQLIDQISELDQPLFVFTGGDPLMRPDLYELARYTIQEKGLSLSMTPSATPRVTRSAVEQAGEAGLSRWAFSLDGSCAKIHDHFRGTPGSYERTMQGIHYLQELHIPIQINTTVSRYNLDDLPQIAELVEQMEAVLWSVFFLIPTGRGMEKDMITPQQHEEVMLWMYELQQRMPFGVKATEAPHYRRVVFQQQSQQHLSSSSTDEIFRQNQKWNMPPSSPGERSGQPGSRSKHRDMLGRAPQGVNDGDGFVFISHTGEVYPSGFLPLSCGNVREQHLSDIYRYAPVMQQLRDKSLLKGKCGVCEFRQLCGGSRARAYALTGDYLESDPYCNYQPAAWTGGEVQ
ncbi:TIGR04053 family radical SAM/SPASM domain-containing protein [Paenibacillus sp. Z6-24]